MGCEVFFFDFLFFTGVIELVLYENAVICSIMIVKSQFQGLKSVARVSHATIHSVVIELLKHGHQELFCNNFVGYVSKLQATLPMPIGITLTETLPDFFLFLFFASNRRWVKV